MSPSQKIRLPRIWLVRFFFGIGVAASGTGLFGLPQESSSDPREVRELLYDKSHAFFVDWLKGQGETDIVTDQNGVGIGGNPTRINALLHDSKESDGGYLIEIEFRIKLPDGRAIIEFQAGIGETEEQAIDETLRSFTVSTCQVVYKALMNVEDPQRETTGCMINGQQRNVIHGDTVTHSNLENPLEDFELSRHVRELLKARELDGRSHWLRVVYGQHQGEVISASVTLNNEGDDQLTEAVKKLPWPKTNSFYLTKQFVIIEATNE